MLKISMRDSVAEIRLDRPPVNAMNPELIRSLATTHANLVADGAAAIVISGRQGLFSAGLDVPELLRLAHGEVLEFWTEFFSLMSALAASPVPVAAAITGHAPAGGAVLALHCDYRVATRGDFLIGLNEVQVGLPVPPNILRMLQYVVGNRTAAKLATAGTMLAPEGALEYGLVDELADEGGAVDAAVLWANGLLELPPLAMNTTRLAAKKILVDMAEANLRYANKATEYWFSEETQRMMRKLVAKLTTKQN
jgi:3,2-trans-enoyl-CoA isomerase